MAARGRLAATLLLAILIGCALSDFSCYNGELSKENKATPTSEKCNGGMCKLVIQYSGMKLTDIKSMSGSCIPEGETGCWKYQGEHKAVCHCKMGECNSKEHQDRALRNAINHAGPSSGQGAWTLVGGAALLYAIHHN